MRLLAVVASLALIACGAHEAVPAHAASTALADGAPAPDLLLTTPSGTKTALADSWRGRKGAIVVFYRGFY